MAWIIGDSFDLYAAAADLTAGSLWDSQPNPGSLVSGRFAGSRAYSVQIFSAGLCLTKVSGSNDATHHFVLAFFQNQALSGSTAGLYLELLDGTTPQCTVVFRSDGVILLTSGDASGSVLATYTGAFLASTWTALEFEITIDASAGALHVRENGSASFNATGLNTRPVSTNNYANALHIGTANSINHVIDDFIWFSTSGAAPNTWVGDMRAVVLRPSADTAQKDFTPNSGSANFSRVNEAQQDGDTTTVSDATVGHNDLYDLDDLATPPLSIVAVQTRGMMRKSDAGARAGQVQLKSGSTTVTSTVLSLSTTYQYVNRLDTVDPDTTAAWTATAVNALKAGPVVQA